MRRATLNIRGQVFISKQKTARFTSCGNLGSGSWTRTNDIRINSKFLISGLFLRHVVLAQISATFCTYLCMRRIAVF